MTFGKMNLYSLHEGLSLYLSILKKPLVVAVGLQLVPDGTDHP
jgi:hypothetical protein